MADVKSPDGAALALLGKKEVLERRFAFISLFAFAVCELITWETVLALFGQSLENGGPAGAVYGFLIAWLSSLSVYVVISELASLAPISGGQYYWVYMMAPTNYKRLASYVVGWLTSLAWIATVATETLFAGTMLQGILTLDYPQYHAKPYQGTLLTWAVVLICVFINTVIPNWLPKFQITIFVFHVAGFIAILVTMLALSPSFSSTELVWRTALNQGHWPTQGLSFCVGFLGNVATFVGADASVHMAEEVANAAVNIPRAIVMAVSFNGLVGFAMMVTTLYCLGPLKSVLESELPFPFIQVFMNSVGNVAGATVMTAVVLVPTIACANGITTSASRMVWSFARDRGLPFSPFVEKLKPNSKIPVISVLLVAVCAMLLTLIYIGSDTAFNDVVSLTITGFYGSYLIPCSLLLYHRIKGNVLPHGSNQTSTPTADVEGDVKNYAEIAETTPVPAAGALDLGTAPLVWGPWRVPGIFGIINNVYACAYMIFVIFWSVWPPATPVVASTMNYSVVVTSGVMIFSAVWYLLGGRRKYKGPLIDDEVAAVMRLGSVVSAR